MNDQNFHNISQRESRFSAGRSDTLNNLYKTIDATDPIKMLELRQIEQEQYYIIQIREQREKMELLKQEFDRRERIMQEQAEQISYLSDQNNKLNQLKNSFQDLISKSENDMFVLRKMATEKEMIENDLFRVQEEQKSLDVKYQILKSDNERLSFLQAETEQSLVKYKSLVREKDQQNFEQLQQIQGEIKYFKTENLQLKDEISKLDETLFGLDYVREQNTNLIDQMKTKEDQDIQLRRKIDKLEKLNEDYKMQIKQISKDLASQEQKHNQQIYDIKIENEKIYKQLKKFEQSNQESKIQNREYEKKRNRLFEDNIALKREIQKLQDFQKENTNHINKLESRHREQEYDMRAAQMELSETQAQLKQVLSKDEQDRKVKHEIDKVKQDLMSVRNSEVQRINELFDGFLVQAPSKFGSSKSKKMSTPSNKKD